MVNVSTVDSALGSGSGRTGTARIALVMRPIAEGEATLEESVAVKKRTQRVIRAHGGGRDL